MKQYILAQTTKGFLLRDEEARGYISNEIYAFSTLKEVQEFLPTLFPEPTVQSTEEE